MSDIVIVIDWDDTLLSSCILTIMSIIQKVGVIDIQFNPTLKLYLAQLEQSAIKLLNALKTIGTVIIVTNSETGWVHLSCERFMPGLLPLLIGENKIPIISAIDLYRNRSKALKSEFIERYTSFRGQEDGLWKYVAICTILNNYASPVTLISIGDSEAERSAASQIKSEIGQTALTYTSPSKVISIKFDNHPTIPGLIHQHNILLTNLKYFTRPGPIDDFKIKLPQSYVAVPIV